MNKLIFEHSDDTENPDGSAILWNKNTCKSEAFYSFVQAKIDQQRQKELQRRLSSNEICGASDCSYMFVNLYNLHNSQSFAGWANQYIQTVGFMKCEDGAYKMYMLSHRTGPCIRLKFSTYINGYSSEIYARIYGLCLIHLNDKATYSEHSGQKCYYEILVIRWFNLGSLQYAHQVEQMLGTVSSRESSKNSLIEV